MQTSLKRCGLKFSSRKDMSAKFPRGGGWGSRTFFSSKSNFILQHSSRKNVHIFSIRMENSVDPDQIASS